MKLRDFGIALSALQKVRTGPVFFSYISAGIELTCSEMLHRKVFVERKTKGSKLHQSTVKKHILISYYCLALNTVKRFTKYRKYFQWMLQKTTTFPLNYHGVWQHICPFHNYSQNLILALVTNCFVLFFFCFKKDAKIFTLEKVHYLRTTVS